MSNHIGAQEEITEARACIWRAVKIEPGCRALEGDIKSADSALDEVQDALRRGTIAWAQDAVREAIDLLRTDESRQIAEDGDALDDAIRLLTGIDWT